MKRPLRRYVFPILILAAYSGFILLSFLYNIQEGRDSLVQLSGFLKQTALLLPGAFILIGLFEVWVSREKVEKHLGAGRGITAYLLAIGMAGTTVGGMYVAFPFAYSLRKKGAGLGVVFSYIGAAAICRIPMTVFEASFIGLKFTIIRYAVSLPLVIVFSGILGSMLEKKGYNFISPEGYNSTDESKEINKNSHLNGRTFNR